tara:strand:- start:1111 stop:1944 length:834 start_codon:yes stop_codon:yes gene_type:complete
MNKKIYSIIGSPLSHSLSPTLHNYWFKKYDINAEYKILEISENEIEQTLKKIKNKEIVGINITLPYKQKVIPFLQELINDSKHTNSVNTVYLDKDEKLIGDNTDVFGLQAGYLKEINLKDAKSKKVLVLGAGGVAPSVILALNKSNLNNISLTNRTFEKSLFLKKRFPGLTLLKWEDYHKSLKEFDIIINATSLGLKGGENFNQLFENCKNSLVYIDTIYNPYETKMIKHLKNKNIKTYNGLDMFIYQGQKSFYLWHKINPEIDDELVNLLISKIRQ